MDPTLKEYAPTLKQAKITTQDKIILEIYTSFEHFLKTLKSKGPQQASYAGSLHEMIVG